MGAPTMIIRTSASLDGDTVRARVTAHGPYVADSKVVPVDDRPKKPEYDDDGNETGNLIHVHPDHALAKGYPGHVTADIDLDELKDGAALKADLQAVLKKIQDAAVAQLDVRFQDAKFETRQVALKRGEIKR